MSKNKQFERIFFPEPINVIHNVPDKCDPHWHHFAEILCYAYPSKYTTVPSITINQTKYRMKPGDVLLIWSNEMHSVEHAPEGTLIGFQFSSSLLTDLPEFASFSHLFRNYHLISPEDPVFAPLAHEMRNNLLKIASYHTGRESFHGVRELMALFEMFIQFGNLLTSNLLTKDLGNVDHSKTIDKINQACRYISDNCEKELTLDHVASTIGFSSCYFSRVFKQTIQCNFIEYLTMQRLKRAQYLLADTGEPITSIAMESGFKSISTFNRVFQKYKGCSPSEYKKHYLLR